MTTQTREDINKKLMYIGMYSGIALAILKFIQYTSPFGVLNSVMVSVMASLVVVCCLIIDRKFSVDWILLGFLAACAVSIIVNKPLRSFQSWERLAFMTVSLMALSSLISNKELHKARTVIWWAMMMGFRFTVLASFVIYLILLISPHLLPDYHIHPLKGICMDYMVLSPIAAVSALDSIWRIVIAQNRKTIIIFSLFAIICIMEMFLSSSRIAIAGFAIGIITIFLLCRNQLKKFLHHKAPIIFGLILLSVAAVFTHDHFMFSINRKMEFVKEFDSFTISRDQKWADRIQEFKDEPLFGIGYASQKYYRSIFDDPENYGKSGNIEPGSSWLSVIAQTGVIGGVLMLCFIIRMFHILYRNLKKRRNREQWAFLSAILAFLLVNGIAEGWILFAGGTMFLPFWLMSGLIIDEATPEVTKLNPCDILRSSQSK